VFALDYLSEVLRCLGYWEQGRARAQEGLQLARELVHPFSIATALFWVAGDHLMAGDYQHALEQAEALVALATEHGFPRWLGAGAYVHAWAQVELGQVEEGLAGIRSIANATRAGGLQLGMPAILIQLAEACGKAGLTDEGLAAVAEALELVERTGECFLAAMLHAARGDLLLAASEGNEAEAETCFRRALDVARSQEARQFELSAATRLARLWQRQGKREEARELLAPIYGWFTEGFDTRDLKDAKALLDELA